MSVLPHGTTRLPLGCSCTVIFGGFVENIQIRVKSNNNRTLREELCASIMVSSPFILTVGNAAGKTLNRKLKHTFYIQ